MCVCVLGGGLREMAGGGVGWGVEGGLVGRR